MPYQHYCSECRRFFASKQRLVSHNLKKHPPSITFEETDYTEMKEGDVFGNDDSEHSEHENESENESQKSEDHDNESIQESDQEDNDGDNEESDGEEEEKNESDDEKSVEDRSESDQSDNDDKPKEWIEYGSINKSDEDEETIWEKISNMAQDELDDEFKEVKDSLEAEGYSGKPLKLETYRKMLKPVRKRIYKIYTNMVDDLDRLECNLVIVSLWCPVGFCTVLC